MHSSFYRRALRAGKVSLFIVAYVGSGGMGTLLVFWPCLPVSDCFRTGVVDSLENMLHRKCFARKAHKLKVF